MSEQDKTDNDKNQPPTDEIKPGIEDIRRGSGLINLEDAGDGTSLRNMESISQGSGLVRINDDGELDPHDK